MTNIQVSSTHILFRVLWCCGNCFPRCGSEKGYQQICLWHTCGIFGGILTVTVLSKSFYASVFSQIKRFYILIIITQEPVVEPFPDVLKQMQHKEYKVTLQLNEENISNGSTVYQSMGIDNAPESFGQHSPLNKGNAETDMSIEEVNIFYVAVLTISVLTQSLILIIIITG